MLAAKRTIQGYSTVIKLLKKRVLAVTDRATDEVDGLETMLEQAVKNTG